MDIKTKYSIGDKVWVMENNQIYYTTIVSIKTESHAGFVTRDFAKTWVGTDIFYKLNNVKDLISENVVGRMYSTKEELLSNLGKYVWNSCESCQISNLSLNQE